MVIPIEILTKAAEADGWTKEPVLLIQKDFPEDGLKVKVEVHVYESEVVFKAFAASRKDGRLLGFSQTWDSPAAVTEAHVPADWLDRVARMAIRDAQAKAIESKPLVVSPATMRDAPDPTA